MATPAASAGRAPGANSAPPPSRSLLRSLRDIVEELPGVVGDRVLLFSLEARRAKLAFAEMVVLVGAAVLLGLTAWLMAWAGIVFGAIALGLDWPWAVLGAVVLHLAGAAYAAKRAAALTHMLAFPATMRHLTSASRSEAEILRDAK